MRRAMWIGVVGAALLAAGCMGGPPGGPHGGGLGRGPGHGPPPGFDDDDAEASPHGRAQLFISPSGQPFRAPAGAPYPSAAWFAAADTNHDGRLTRAEFRADAEAWFKVLDQNGDGQISMPEVTRWEEELVPEILRGGLGGMMGGMGGGRGMRGKALGQNQIDTRRDGASPYSLINEPHPIRGADTDFSMSVSRQEWAAAADRRFAILDPDGDGVILATDLRPTPAQLAAGRVEPGARGGQQGRPKPPAGERPPR